MKFNILIILILLELNLIKCFYVNKAHCSSNKNCKLPDCNCGSHEIPIKIENKYRLDELPQLVILTIDDQDLDYKSYQVYRKLFQDLRNPNNCTIKATFFISDSNNKTSYCLLRNLYENGHEIAISTLNYECPHTLCNSIPTFEPWDYKYWTQQILTMRKNIENFAAIPRSFINGFRAPLLEPCANMHYRIISAHNFLYDSSLLINDERITWPFTLDFKTDLPLSNNGPTESFKSLWELPIHVYTDSEGNACLKFWEGHCKYENSAHGISKFLRQNFLRSYYNNRAPYVINLNSEWLKIDVESDFSQTIHPKGFYKNRKLNIVGKKFYKNLEGVVKFINETLQNNDDVYFVTANEAIRWMKHLSFLSKNYKSYKNLTKYLNDFILKNSDNEYECPTPNYDGACDYLHLKTPDYNETEFLVDIDITSDKALTNDTKTLIELQSELLFINHVIGYFVVFLIISFILVFIYDRIY